MLIIIANRESNRLRRIAEPCQRCAYDKASENPFLSAKKQLYPRVQIKLLWRRERDSNPRYVLPYTRFPIVRLRPAQPSLHVIIKLFALSQREEYSLRNLLRKAIGGACRESNRLQRIAEPSVRFTVHTIESRALGQLSHLCTPIFYRKSNIIIKTTILQRFISKLL